MKTEQKIAQVLKKIKDESEISLDPKWVKFNFNKIGLIGDGILSADEERKILLKLQKEEIIRLDTCKKTDDEEIDVEAIVVLSPFNPVNPEKFMFESSFIWVEILKGFNKKYRLYRFYSKDNINYWNFVNPFWWIWKAILLVLKITKIIWKHKIISFIFTIIGLLALDYSMAWENLNHIIDFIKEEFF